MLIRRFPEKQEFIKHTKRGNLIPVCVEFLADTETPVTVLAKLKKLNNSCFLFESVEGGQNWARYSFIGTSAYQHVFLFKDKIEIVHKDGSIKSTFFQDPFSGIRSLMNSFIPVPLDGLPPFWGGIVGFFNYETVSFIERINHSWPDDKPMAQFMITDNLIIFDNVRHIMTIVSHVFLESGKSPEIQYDDAMEKINQMIFNIKNNTYDENCRVSGFNELRPAISSEDFINSVTAVKNHIIEGDIIQAVISQPFISDGKIDSLMLYRLQRYINPSPYMFYFKINDTCLVGSSPETMVRLENGVATLRPIAGTRKRGINDREDHLLADELLRDEKEKAEHLMLVDLGRNDLGKVAVTGTVQVTDLMFIERYSHVMHLVSNICCDLKKDLDAWDLFKASFPAGTLSGAPKIRAMQIISELEKYPRGPYGGAVGYVSFDGNMDFAITIRTALIEENKITIQAGAGIVADSVPEAEFEETINKAMAMKKAISMVTNFSV